jgi:hypothetical protein
VLQAKKPVHMPVIPAGLFPALSRQPEKLLRSYRHM